MNTDIENVRRSKESFNKILDIGTGTGYLAFPLAEKFPTASVCGIDIAEVIVEKNNN